MPILPSSLLPGPLRMESMTRALLTYTGGCKQLLGWEEGLTLILCALTTSFLNCWGAGTCEKSLAPESGIRQCGVLFMLHLAVVC